MRHSPRHFNVNRDQVFRGQFRYTIDTHVLLIIRIQKVLCSSRFIRNFSGVLGIKH